MAMSENLEFPNFFGTVKDLAQARYYQAERDKIKGVGINPADVSATMQGDRDALGRVAAVNPDMATRLTMALSHMDARQATVAKGHIELAGRLSAGILSAPPDQRPALYAAALDQARSLGIDTSKFPQDYGPATEGFLKHNLQMLGTATQVFKRVGAGGGAPAGGGGGGGGGWTNPVTPGARTSDATPPGGPMVADAGGAAPPMPAPTVAGMPQTAPALAPPAQAPTAVAGAGPLPMALPPSAPRIAPTAAPAGPTQTAGLQPPQTPQVVSPGSAYEQGGNDGVFVPAERVNGGRIVGLPPGAEVKVDAHNKPIETAGHIYLRLADKSLVMFDPKSEAIQPSGQPVAPRHTPADAWSLVNQLATAFPGAQLGKDKLGQPARLPDGGYVFYHPDGTLDVFRPKAPPATRADPPGYRTDPNNPDALAAIPGGPADPAQAKELAAAKARDNAKSIPPSVLKGIDENLTSLRKIDKVVELLAKQPGSVGGVGIGAATVVPGGDWLLNQFDKSGTSLRAVVADIGSLKVHDRSGAAVSAAEEPRLRPFIPKVSDPPDVIRDKLANFKAEYMAILRDQQNYYSLENGYRPYKGLDDYMSGGGAPAPAAPATAAPKSTDKPVLIYDPKTGKLE